MRCVSIVVVAMIERDGVVIVDRVYSLVDRVCC